jgi:hypothetical protein
MERIGALLPIGSGDPSSHHGARRRSRRFPLNAEVDVLEPVRASGVTLNASAGGLRIVVDQELKAGSVCELSVHFTAEKVSRETARVVWSRTMRDGWVLGLEFLDIDWDIPDPALNRAA